MFFHVKNYQCSRERLYLELAKLRHKAHLLNFSGDIYGEQVSISLVSFLRPELKFNSSAELINQMRVDCDIALRTIRESNFK